MNLAQVLENLKKAKEIALHVADSGADVLERIEEVTLKVSEAVKQAREYLRNLSPNGPVASAHEGAAVGSGEDADQVKQTVADFEDFQEELWDHTRRPAPMGKPQMGALPPVVTAALIKLLAVVVDRIIDRLHDADGG